jgi:DNA-binding NarL/FixJ family response regulator
MTPRQLLILRLRATGATNAEVGLALGIAEQTVKEHVWLAYRELSVSNIVAAFLVLGWLRPPDHMPSSSPDAELAGGVLGLT